MAARADSRAQRAADAEDRAITRTKRANVDVAQSFRHHFFVPHAWSRDEVEAAVADYFDMLARELRGELFNKAEHNRALQRILNNRSHGAIERKHQNISAILIELGYPYIDGYKPLGNYQELLQAVVRIRLAAATDLDRTVANVVEQPALGTPPIDDLLAIQVDAPMHEAKNIRVREEPFKKPEFVRRNYLELEARNQSLGRAGELLALRFERERLWRIAPKLASNIRHVSEIEGDYLGYDILSFEADGRERLIEVKTTRFFLHRAPKSIRRSNGVENTSSIVYLRSALIQNCLRFRVRCENRAGSIRLRTRRCLCSRGGLRR